MFFVQIITQKIGYLQYLEKIVVSNHLPSSGWWFGTFFMFPYISNNHPNWRIFFRGVGIPPTSHEYIPSRDSLLGLPGLIRGLLALPRTNTSRPSQGRNGYIVFCYTVLVLYRYRYTYIARPCTQTNCKYNYMYNYHIYIHTYRH